MDPVPSEPGNVKHLRQRPYLQVNNKIHREFKLHVYDKRQTSDSSREFLKIENEQIKTAQKLFLWKKIA